MNKQRGQAMTEMLVASAFVLVPLFLIVPLVGKYIDMKQAAVSASRYVAWEGTVSNYPDAIEMAAVIYAEAGDGLVNNRGCEGREFWRDHQQTNMFEATGINDANTGCKDTNLATDETIHDVYKLGGQVGVVTVVNAIGEVFDFLSDYLPGNFDVINTEGRTSAAVTLTVAEPANYSHIKKTEPLLEIGSLQFTVPGEVYSDGWATPNKDELNEKVKALVPTNIITAGFDGLSDLIEGIFPGADINIQNALAAVTLSPEIESSQLEFGKIDLDVLPRDKYLDPADSKLRQYRTDNPGPDLCTSEGYCRE